MHFFHALDLTQYCTTLYPAPNIIFRTSENVFHMFCHSIQRNPTAGLLILYHVQAQCEAQTPPNDSAHVKDLFLAHDCSLFVSRFPHKNFFL